MVTTSSAPRPPVVTGPVGKSAPTRVSRTTTVNVKASITDSFTNLDNFTVLAKTPTITSGRLSGQGIVRHRDQMCSDDFKVTATVGATDWFGSTRLVTCGSATFSSFYGLDVAMTGSPTAAWRIIKGFGIPALLENGLWSPSLDRTDPPVSANIVPGDQITVWWDETTSVIRGYRNTTQVISLPVPRWGISHGDGFRHWGVAQGVDLFLDIVNRGIEFTSIAAADQ